MGDTLLLPWVQTARTARVSQNLLNRIPPISRVGKCKWATQCCSSECRSTALLRYCKNYPYGSSQFLEEEMQMGESLSLL